MIEGASMTQGDSLSDLKYWLNFTGIEPNKCQIYFVDTARRIRRDEYIDDRRGERDTG